MRQRVMIAMAISCNPKLLIADEPTTALDVTVQAQILELMKDLAQRLDIALIFITHNLGIVARYADRVVVMYAGKPVEQAPVGCAVRIASASLHDRSAACRAAPGSPARRPAGDDRGPSPQFHEPAAGLPVRPEMSLADGEMR